MKPKPPSIEENPFSVLKLSVTRLMHIREVQSTGGGHFAQVARELGYVREEQPISEEELKWVEQQLAHADEVRRKRNEHLIDRLKAARERLGVSSLPPPLRPGSMWPKS